MSLTINTVSSFLKFIGLNCKNHSFALNTRGQTFRQELHIAFRKSLFRVSRTSHFLAAQEATMSDMQRGEAVDGDEHSVAQILIDGPLLPYEDTEDDENYELPEDERDSDDPSEDSEGDNEYESDWEDDLQMHGGMSNDKQLEEYKNETWPKILLAVHDHNFTAEPGFPQKLKELWQNETGQEFKNEKSVESASMECIGYCLTVMIADPDHRRPSVETFVEHHKTEEDAQKALKKYQNKFLKNSMVKASNNIFESRTAMEEYAELLYDVCGNMEMLPFQSFITPIVWGNPIHLGSGY
jgi:hypothetical protein